MDDEDSILPHKLQAALEHVLERRKELACDVADHPNGNLPSDPLYSRVRNITALILAEDAEFKNIKKNSPSCIFFFFTK